MNTQITPDRNHRLVLTRELRRTVGIKAGQKLEVQAAPGYLIITTPTVPAKLVKHGKLKLIDGPRQKVSAAQAVELSRRETR